MTTLYLINKTISYDLIGCIVSKQTKTVKKVTFYLVMNCMYMRVGDYFGGVRFASFSLLQ